MKAPREAKVALRFVDFSLEPDDECTFDFVEIWDGQQDGLSLFPRLSCSMVPFICRPDPAGWRSLGRLCGDKGENTELVSSENRMRLKFHSDNSTESRGFVANFQLVFPEDSLPEVAAGNATVMQNRTLVPAIKLMQEIPGDVAVAQDEEVFLNCIPKAPGYNVTWFKDGLMVNGAEPLPDLYLVPPSTLWIRRMHSNLTGSYTCRVIAITWRPRLRA
ncbi:hypothetical protein HPB52_016713 [Rhipicephalus sanguineus]|uniref:Ig-like domain-containing protein n=1 Tax=Rhipicephalus sanguineus TaxID=34632 RepID=A0A9D4PK98_RHISA|nr:hypothetical protein HPB52_016713 [Rhipicephalus sanguineus]